MAGKTIKKANPKYAWYIALDQQLLSYLVSSLSRNVLPSVQTLDTSAQVWTALGSMYALQTQARTITTRLALATTNKGDMSIVDYYGMKSYGDDELVVPENPLKMITLYRTSSRALVPSTARLFPLY